MDLGTVSTLWYFLVFYFIVIISPAISEKKRLKCVIDTYLIICHCKYL